MNLCATVILQVCEHHRTQESEILAITRKRERARESRKAQLAALNVHKSSSSGAALDQGTRHQYIEDIMNKERQSKTAAPTRPPRRVPTVSHESVDKMQARLHSMSRSEDASLERELEVARRRHLAERTSLERAVRDVMELVHRGDSREDATRHGPAGPRRRNEYSWTRALQLETPSAASADAVESEPGITKEQREYYYYYCYYYGSYDDY